MLRRIEFHLIAGEPTRNDLRVATVRNAAQVSWRAECVAIAEPAPERTLAREPYDVPVDLELIVFLLHLPSVARVACGASVDIRWR